MSQRRAAVGTTETTTLTTGSIPLAIIPVFPQVRRSRRQPGVFVDPGTTGSRTIIITPSPGQRPQYNPELDQDGYPKPHIRLLDK
ncbi:MAG: hypothetical protein ACR2IE_20010 [Candidatus Sumerlaeaceae bacterium]